MYMLFINIAKSLKKSFSEGSLSESINSDDLMLDIDYDPTDDKFVDSDNEDLLKTLESTKHNTFHEFKSLTSERYLTIIISKVILSYIHTVSLYNNVCGIIIIYAGK